MLLCTFFFFSVIPSIQVQWATQKKNSNHQLADVYFTDQNEGFIGGVEGIYITIDGGVNWNLLPYFQPGSGRLDSIVYVYFNHIYTFSKKNIYSNDMNMKIILLVKYILLLLKKGLIPFFLTF